MTDFSGLAAPGKRVPVEILSGAVVLQIVPTLDGSGAGRDTIDVAAALAEMGARALVAADGGRHVGDLQARGGMWMPFAASSRNPLALWRNGRRLARIVRDEQIDIVHARGLSPAWSFHLMPGRVAPPWALTLDGPEPAEGRLGGRFAGVARRADSILAGSHLAGDLLAQRWPDAADRIHVVPIGIDLGAFSPPVVPFERVEALRRSWDLGAGERFVLMPRLEGEGDGHDTFLEAAAMLRNAGVEDTLFLVADDGRAPKLSGGFDHVIAAAGLQGTVKRVPTAADDPAAYLAASAVVVPMDVLRDGGRMAAEAQAMGCPVVASSNSTAAEIVLAPPETPDLVRTGWRVPPGDPAALAQAISDALALGASARDAMSLRARAHVERHHSVRAMCRETLTVYAGLLGSGTTS
jgi:glycosyltransferase involved in cell wall biosynthesis